MDYTYESLYLNMEMGTGIQAAALSSAAFDPADAFSVDLWVRFSDCSTTKSLLSKEGAFSLAVQKNKVVFSVQGYQPVMTEEALPANTWVYIAVSCYHKNVRIFLDGALAAEQLVTGTAAASAKPVEIGRDFFGALRLLRVYQSALTAQDVAEMMYKDTATAQMLACYDFTQNPPKELVGGDSVTLPAGSKIMLGMPAAQCRWGAYLDVTPDEPVNPAGKRNTPYTVQMWIRAESAEEGQVQTVFYNADPTGAAGMELFLVKCTQGYKACAAHGLLGSAGNQIQATDVLSTGKWVNLAVTWEDKKLTLYMDGVQQAKKMDAAPLGWALTKKNTLIGARAACYDPNGDRWFQGCVSRVDVWDKALTPAQLLSFANAEPDWNAAGLTGSWSLFTDCVANRVSSRPVARRNGLPILEKQAAALVGQAEWRRPLLHAAPEPLSPRQLAECRQRALDENGKFSAEKGSFRVNTCRTGDMVYFVLHSEACSYTACSLRTDELGDDPMMEWRIGMLLVLLSALISLIFSMNLTYNTQLGTYLRLQVANNPQILIWLSNVRDVSSAGTFVVLLLRQLISENQIWQLLTLCVQVSFWGLVSAVTRLTAKLFGGPASWAAWLLLAGSAILYQLSKKPAPIPHLVITSIRFNHCRSNSICSINIRKNESTPWDLPEWTPASQFKRVPAVYRIARFNTGARNPLQIDVTFACTNLAPHVERIRGIAVGPNRTWMGDTDELDVPLINGVSAKMYFTLSHHTLATQGIGRKEVSWRWEYLQDGSWKTIGTTDHTIYTILDSVHAPWSILPDQSNNLWTDCLDLILTAVDGQTTAPGVMSQLTQMLNTMPNVEYSGNSAYTFGSTQNGVHVRTFLLSQFMQELADATATKKLRINCEDCCSYVTVFANAVGCHAQRANLARDFEVPEILLIGETTWRKPEEGFFEYHAVACVPTSVPAGQDPTKYQVYDPCLRYHDPAGTVVLAQGVPMSQYSVVPPDPQPLPGYYREDLVTLAGLPSCDLVSVEWMSI